MPPVFKNSGPGQVAIPMVQGLRGRRGWVWGLFYTSFSHLEKQLEAKQEGTSRRASELWNVSGTSGWIRYPEGEGDVCS